MNINEMSNAEINIACATKIMEIDKESIFTNSSGVAFSGNSPLIYTNSFDSANELMVAVKGKLFSKRKLFMDNLQSIASDGKLDSKSLVAWPDVMWFVEPKHICIADLLAWEGEKWTN